MCIIDNLAIFVHFTLYTARGHSMLLIIIIIIMNMLGEGLQFIVSFTASYSSEFHNAQEFKINFTSCLATIAVIT